VYKTLFREHEEKRDHSEDLDTCGKIILDWFLGK